MVRTQVHDHLTFRLTLIDQLVRPYMTVDYVCVGNELINTLE